MNALAGKNSFIHQLHPGVRLGVFAGLAGLFCWCSSFLVLVMGLVLALGGLFAARISFREICARLAGLNFFLLMLFLLAPLNSGGQVLFRLGPFSYEQHGLDLAARISLKANIILLTATFLLATMTISRLGQMLATLPLTRKLALLLIFTAYSLEAAAREYNNLRLALKARCFRPGLNVHTYRTLAHFAAMLLVRGHDRAEKILAAMKCRGFKGKYYLPDHLFFTWRDGAFVLLSAMLLLILCLGEIWISP